MDRLETIDPESYALPDERLAEYLSPALFIYLDRVRDNLAAMLRHVGGDAERWRPHVKTAKIPAIFREMASAGVRHFKCATTREADELLAALQVMGIGVADLLVAFPLIGPALTRLGNLARAHPGVRVSVLAEDAAALPHIPESVSVFVDVNPGMNRTGVPLEDIDSILAVGHRAGARFRGVHYYDGHLHAYPEGEARRNAAVDIYGRLLELVGSLQRSGIPVEEIVTSGTPSFRHALAYPGFGELTNTRHRISPGTVVYHDLRSEEENEGLNLVPAALVFSRVVSHPSADRITADAGSKALAAEAGDPCALALGRPELHALTPNEEHLPFRVTGARPARGDALLLFPRHVCPTINLAEEAVLIENGEVKDIVRVAARAHELRVR